ncbi:MAG: M23 family metallopeptidase [Desulfovibrionaceae bacterium]|nr:M23 family metallopeptidase [Desulfovibrionaceae bacterium]
MKTRLFAILLIVFTAVQLACASPAKHPQAPAPAYASPMHPSLGSAVTHTSGGLSASAVSAVDEGGIVPAAIHSAPANAAKAVLHWRGKSIEIPLKNGRGLALLPVPLDRGKDTDLPLSLQAGEEKLTFSIRIRKVDWPVRQLTVNKQYSSPPPQVLARIAEDRARTKKALQNASAERFWQLPFTRPVAGVVTSSFGGKRLFNGELRSRHMGADMRAAEGTPIRAAAAGRVLLAEDQYYGGNLVYIDHGQGLMTLYCHCSRLNVRPGDWVAAGQVIGLAGSTGRVTGPHLHLGVRLYGEMLNPLSLFLLR